MELCKSLILETIELSRCAGQRLSEVDHNSSCEPGDNRGLLPPNEISDRVPHKNNSFTAIATEDYSNPLVSSGI
jgi:hypothetical protein